MNWINESWVLQKGPLNVPDSKTQIAYHNSPNVILTDTMTFRWKDSKCPKLIKSLFISSSYLLFLKGNLLLKLKEEDGILVCLEASLSDDQKN